jgi:hypothetical protein
MRETGDNVSQFAWRRQCPFPSRQLTEEAAPAMFTAQIGAAR